MIELERNTFGLYTYYPFDEECHRHHMRIVRINTYSNGNLQYDHLFPPPVRNFHGCTLNLCLRVAHPVVLDFRGNRNDPKDLQGFDRLFGIEADIFRNLAKAMNFRVDISIPEEISTIGGHNDSTGCFAELASGRSDVAIGSLTISYGLRDVFSYSISYHQSPFVFIVRRGLHFGPMKQLAQAFCGSVWLAIGVCCVGGMIFIRLVIRHANPSTCEKLIGNPRRSDCTSLIITMMGNPLQVLPRRNSARLLLMAWLLATLVLRSAYQSKLFDTLRTSQRMPVPNSIAGLVENKYILLADRYVNFYPENMTLIVLNVAERYRFVQNSESIRFATFSMLDTLTWHNQLNWNTSRLTYIPEPIYLMQVSMFFKKHSILRSIFNYRIQQLMGAGITSHIAQKHVVKKFQGMNERLQRLPAISSNMLSGLYLLYAFLMAVACLLFALELLAHRNLRVKRLIDWMHLVERA
ncbi:uncharacterized protein LOC110117946 [Ceratitis capitata]|uniref:uncharacterized protein LOC110117946 n=1 Tax=Ceratitis capitata TaxID=7213 RepID=UPI000C6C49A2|nr:uncharacterized protein LOC110117946 [Ceratitis capitata]